MPINLGEGLTTNQKEELKKAAEEELNKRTAQGKIQDPASMVLPAPPQQEPKKQTVKDLQKDNGPAVPIPPPPPEGSGNENQNEKKNGIFKNDDGSEEEWINGKLIFLRKYYSDGTLKRESKNDGSFTEYTKNGKKYKYRSPDGGEIFYKQDGSKKSPEQSTNINKNENPPESEERPGSLDGPQENVLDPQDEDAPRPKEQMLIDLIRQWSEEDNEEDRLLMELIKERDKLIGTESDKGAEDQSIEDEITKIEKEIAIQENLLKNTSESYSKVSKWRFLKRDKLYNNLVDLNYKIEDLKKKKEILEEKQVEKMEISEDKKNKPYAYYLVSKISDKKFIERTLMKNGLVDLRWLSSDRGYKFATREAIYYVDEDYNEGYFYFSVSGFCMVIKNIKELKDKDGVADKSSKAIYKITGPDGNIIEDNINGYQKAYSIYQAKVKEYEDKAREEFNSLTK